MTGDVPGPNKLVLDRLYTITGDIPGPNKLAQYIKNRVNQI